MGDVWKNVREEMDRRGWTDVYVMKLIFKWAMVLLILNGLNVFLMALFDVNVIRSILGKGWIRTTLQVLTGFAAIALMFQRDTYLPFLGPMVAPCGAFADRDPPGATKEIRITIKPRTKVLYWAAEPANESLKEVPSWKEAYQKYENAGVATSDGQGVAVLKIRAPGAYRVPFRGLLSPHVHYRVCDEAGWMGSIQTVPVDGKRPVEGYSEGVEESFASV
jgi:uncharacterized membrane protein YuzA (DUF378 family)